MSNLEGRSDEEVYDIRDAAQKVVEEANAELARRRRNRLSLCPHDWKYVPDPSGNNDSDNVCCKCGTYMSELQR